MTFKLSLEHKIKLAGSPLCLGVDPHFHGLPNFMEKMIEAKGAPYFLEWFGESLLTAAKEQNVAAVKFQAAFFEAQGIKGHKVLENLLKKSKNLGVTSILDAKRGDISSTMEAYGKAAFEAMEADILTVTPYMGFDVIKPLEPWLKNGKGVYVVWMSSNPSGKDIQEITGQDGKLVSESLFDIIQTQALNFGFPDSIGYVLGATKVDGLSAGLFEKIKHSPLLMPGVGAQGATTNDKRIQELMAMNIHLIPVSRGISGYGKGYQDNGLADVVESNYPEFIATKIRAFNTDLA
ncbi:orotidine-5'-phosphate decarboxylase [bacterium]|nr:orotidine-5'-phosphate decarboxylase [bacterium]